MPSRSYAWWKSYSTSLFLTTEPRSLAEQMSIKYENLSHGHLYYLVIQIFRFICWEFVSERGKTEEGQLNIINSLQQIIDQQAVSEANQASEHIDTLFELNNSDVEVMEWVLSNAIGPKANKLNDLPNVSNYFTAAKEIIRQAILFVSRDFYNFLVTKSDLSENEQTMTEKLENLIMKINLPQAGLIPPKLSKTTSPFAQNN